MYAYTGGDPINFVDPMGLAANDGATPKQDLLGFTKEELDHYEFCRKNPQHCEEEVKDLIDTIGKKIADLDSGDHQYVIETLACYKCDPKDVFEAWRHFSAPGAGYSKSGTNKQVLFFGWPIKQVVDVNGMKITNITLPGHGFYFGTVEISLVQRNDSVFSRIVGTGTGGNRAFNYLSGLAAFNAAAYQVFLTMNPGYGAVY